MQFYGMNGIGWVFARRFLLLLALLSTLGITVVANFQETNVPAAHGLGAWLAFFWYLKITLITNPSASLVACFMFGCI